MRMHSLLTKRFEIPETWVAAFLLPFKLFTVSMAVWLIIWYMMLPPNHTSAQTGIDEAFFSATSDFSIIARSMCLLYFLATCVLVIGGLVQLFKYSRRAGLWSIAFGAFAFTIGIILAVVCDSLPDGYEFLRNVA